jgi:uncharacterized membrane protein YsdA (DUF1294 family)
MLLRRADQQGLLLWVVLGLAVFVALALWTQWPPLLDLFLATTISTFLVMMIDKVQARTGDRRISERSLYIMSFLGGSVGMLVAMYTLRHKSRKLSFQIVVFLLVLVQLVLVYNFVDLPFLSNEQNDPFQIN